MKKVSRLLAIFISIIMLFSFNIYGVFADQLDKKITILFTHDMHDHILPFDLLQDGEKRDVGGYARLQSAIKEERKKDSQLLLVDAGDFSMGSLFQTIYTAEAPGLRLMGQMGYDVVTFGNHEFDFRADGLADSLNSAKKSKDRLRLQMPLM